MKRYLYILAAIASFVFFAAGCTTYRSYGQGGYGNNYPNRTYDDGYYGDDGYYDNGNYGYDDRYDRYDGYDNRYGRGNVTFDVFYNELRPHGTWRNHSRYGNIWIPRVSNFRPYSTNGYWVNTNMGWNWMSNYDWGWAPFHYGRWGYDNMFGGWFWVPDYTWGPSWVTWGNGPDYYGWAPMAPGMNVGVSVNIGNIASIYWNFLPHRYMGYRNMYDYYLPYSRNNYYVRNTTIINNYNYYGNDRNTRYYSGPSVNDVSRRSGREVRTYNIENTPNRSYNGRTSNDRLSVYTGGSRSYTPSRSNTSSDRNVNSSTPSRSYTPSRSNSNVDARSNSGGNTPSRSYTPSRSTTPSVNRSSSERSTAPSRSYTPSRSSSSSVNRSSAPASSAPSRSYSSPSRSSAPSVNSQRSAPSRSYTPSRSSSSSVNRSSAPASSAPSRSYSSPSRSSAPSVSSQRSAPSRSYSAPSRSSSSSSSSSSAPSRSYTPRR